VAAKIKAIPEKRVQSNIAAASGMLAGLKLERDFINQVLVNWVEKIGGA
jgi:hypothetical protein